jgi:hypothetical protein
LLLVAAVGLFVSGCGKSPEAPPVSDNLSSQAPAAKDATTDSGTTEVFRSTKPLDLAPDTAVAAFLKALRDGDDVLAESLLTTKAREETAKHDLAVQPPGTPSATFEIGEVEYITADKRGAHVHSVWMEQDDQGVPVSYDIVWALRRQAEGWRVAGMATKVTPADPPVFLNFEEPAEMVRRWEEAEARLAAEPPDAPMRQATRPAGPTEATPQTR